MSSVSPMMQQWHECKEKAKNAVLLFRLGDFYEAFYDDAKLIAKELDLTLTQRQSIPMAGVPFHIVDGYIEKLVAKGHLVAIAEQIEDPKQTKGLVKRDIVRTISPATIINSSLVSEKSNNFFVSIAQQDGIIGLSLLDFSTGELSVCETTEAKELFDELNRRMPTEILVSHKCRKMFHRSFDELKLSFTHSCIERDDWHFDFKTSNDWLSKRFQVHLDGFGLKGMTAAIGATGALLNYLHMELDCDISHIKSIAPLILSSFLSIDRATQRHLELLTPLHSSDSKTLLGLLDETQTAMGGRLLKTWLVHPLLSVSKIRTRHDALDELIRYSDVTLMLRKHLSPIRDLERLIMRIETSFASPRDLIALKVSLSPIKSIREIIQNLTAPLFKSILDRLVDLTSISELLEKALVEHPPLRLSEGNLFKRGYHAELDELLEIRENSQNYLVKYQNKLRETLGIKTLRVNYNKAFGYFIEVSRGQADKMPSHFERRQTLVNAQRYTTSELKEFEYKILTAEEKTQALEYTLFHELRKKIATCANSIRSIASAIAELDCLFSLSVVSRRNQYVRPYIDESDIIHIEEGRHPVIEIAHKEHFIPNDTLLNDQKRLMIITGPNMAGKSTYIRQVALLVIMAQMGCFIPAKKASIGIVDKVFSRIGASDDLSRGQSTFMVEMIETANILNNATSKSLVILDEIGRGTSTYDGISIAAAVAEYLLTTKERRAKTLFATHYYELTELADKIPGAINYHVAIKESEDGIVFLRKIIQGSTDKSYGIHVAKWAGIPEIVIKNAFKQLHLLETQHEIPPKKKSSSSEDQWILFAKEKPSKYDALGKELKALNLNRISPMEALQKLFDWQRSYESK